MNLKKKTILTFFCLVFINQASAMFMPYYMPMYAPLTVIVPNTTPEKLTRKWLNWLYAQNNSITSSGDVRSNIDYYHDMIQNHYSKLVFKKQNRDLVKNIKLKRLVLISAINALTWSAVVFFFKQVRNTPSYESDMGNLFLASLASGLGIFSLACNCASIFSYRNHDTVLDRNLKRDEHMLQQFEEYKAVSKTKHKSS